ncbi:MAG: AI-2E family transporter [Chloroflexota bacterium]
MGAPSLPFVVGLIGGIVLVLVLVASASALLVFAIGAALAFFLVPVVGRLERRGMPRFLAALLVVALLVVATIAILLLVAYVVIEQGTAFVANLPTYMAQIRAGIASLQLPAWLESAIDSTGAAAAGGAAAVDPAAIATGLLQGVLGAVGVLFSFFLLPFFLFYLLKDQPRMAAGFYRAVPGPWRADVTQVLSIAHRDLATFVKAELMVGAIQCCIVATGNALIGIFVPGAHVMLTFALLLGLFAFLFEAIPQIGPIFAYIPALLLSLTAGPETVIAVGIFYFAAFNFEGSVLVPAFQGQMISFGGATVLVVITIGFALAGIIGAIVALPVAAIARDTFGHFFHRAQELAAGPADAAMPGADAVRAAPSPERGTT